MRLWTLCAALLAVAGEIAQGENVKARLTNSLGVEFILVQPGRMQEAVFAPTCPDTERHETDLQWTPDDFQLCGELTRHAASPGFPVAIRRAFYLGKFEITQEQWTRVMGYNPSTFQGTRVAGIDTRRHPVESVTWADAQAFVSKLNEREHTHAYRLPSEFEWEYAGRAGGAGQLAWDEIRRQAVVGLRAPPGGSGSKPATQPVGSKLPNRWGFYDMLGNVWEWVTDRYNEKTFPDPQPPLMGSEHVLKGGGFASDVKNTIYATHGGGPGDRWDVGFRIVKDVGE